MKRYLCFLMDFKDLVCPIINALLRNIGLPKVFSQRDFPHFARVSCIRKMLIVLVPDILSY